MKFMFWQEKSNTEHKLSMDEIDLMQADGMFMHPSKEDLEPPNNTYAITAICGLVLAMVGFIVLLFT